MKKNLKITLTILTGITIIVLVVLKLQANIDKKNEDTNFDNIGAEEIPVNTETILRSTISNTIYANGVFSPFADLTIISETKGRIIKKYKKVGDHVRPGEIIACADDEIIQAEMLTAEANFKAFEKDLERFERLYEQNAITQKQLQDMKTGWQKAKSDYTKAKRYYNDTRIKSPINGIINAEFIEKGQFLGPGAPVCEIVDISKMKIVIQVSEYDIIYLEKGQKVKIFPKVYPDLEIEGTVSTIAVKACNGLKYNVEIISENPDKKLKAGMFAEIEIEIPDTKDCILINKKALVGSYDDASVFVIKQDNTVTKRNIKIGKTFNDQIEIIEGLTEGDKVVIEGQLNLDEGTKVKTDQNGTVN